MDAVGKTISDHFRNNDVGAVATPAIRAIQDWLIEGNLTRQSFDSLEPELTHLDPDERKGLLLDFVMSFTVACSDDLELDDHEMECLRTLNVLFRVEEGDFCPIRFL